MSPVSPDYPLSDNYAHEHQHIRVIVLDNGITRATWRHQFRLYSRDIRRSFHLPQFSKNGLSNEQTEHGQYHDTGPNSHTQAHVADQRRHRACPQATERTQS
jgi:hypothetical protein